MPDFTDFERAAMTSCLGPLSEFASEIGLQKPLGEYSKEQILTMIEVIINQYQTEMRKGSPEVPF